MKSLNLSATAEKKEKSVTVAHENGDDAALKGDKDTQNNTNDKKLKQNHSRNQCEIFDEEWAPFLAEVNRAIFGGTTGHPKNGSAEYFQAAQNYAVHGKDFMDFPPDISKLSPEKRSSAAAGAQRKTSLFLKGMLNATTGPEADKKPAPAPPARAPAAPEPSITSAPKIAKHVSFGPNTVGYRRADTSVKHALRPTASLVPSAREPVVGRFPGNQAFSMHPPSAPQHVPYNQPAFRAIRGAGYVSGAKNATNSTTKRPSAPTNNLYERQVMQTLVYQKMQQQMLQQMQQQMQQHVAAVAAAASAQLSMMQHRQQQPTGGPGNAEAVRGDNVGAGESPAAGVDVEEGKESPLIRAFLSELLAQHGIAADKSPSDKVDKKLATSTDEDD